MELLDLDKDDSYNYVLLSCHYINKHKNFFQEIKNFALLINDFIDLL